MTWPNIFITLMLLMNAMLLFLIFFEPINPPH